MTGASGKPRKPKPKAEPDDPVQSARFIESAKTLGVDETGEAFKRAIDTLLPKKRAKKRKAS